MIRQRPRSALIGAAIGLTALAATAAAQHRHGDAAKPSVSAPAGTRRITMDELHRLGGVPRGWKFTLPAGGDAARGKQVFTDLECFKCHEVAGFPAPAGDGKAGPPLTSMGGHHPAEYFAESIVAPNAVLLEGPGYIGPDGRSIMPSYADALSVTQLLDLVAFIRSQDGGHAAHQAQGPASRELDAGPYRIRLGFEPAKAAATGTGGQGHGAHGGHGAHSGHGAQGQQAGAAEAGHLVVFVSDAASGEAVPYLPVSAVVHADGVPARTVKLAPMLGPNGFHYGAHTSLAAGTRRIVVNVGPPSIRVMGDDGGRYARPQRVTFSWSAPGKS